jgi:hypothetical protein
VKCFVRVIYKQLSFRCVFCQNRFNRIHFSTRVESVTALIFIPRVLRIQTPPLSRIFEFSLCCSEIGFNEGGILYCWVDCSFSHNILNVRSTECLTFRGIITCGGSCNKCLFFNDLSKFISTNQFNIVAQSFLDI